MRERKTAEIGEWFLEALDYGALVACEDDCLQGDATEKDVNSDPCSPIRHAEVNCGLKIQIWDSLPSMNASCSPSPFLPLC